MYYPKFSTITALFFLCISMLFPSQALMGQGIPQAEQDCINAIPICNQIISQPNSYTGEGANPNEIDPIISCLGSGEENDVWYRVEVVGAGTLSFLIEPLNLIDDYDFAVYNLTNASCSDIRTNASLEVSCNYSATAGPTGTTLPGGASSNGAGGPNRNGPIPVLAGETYVINVSNFSSTARGFQLNLTTSTALFANSSTSSPMPDTLYQSGDTDTLIFAFSEPILCSSISPSSLGVSFNSSPSGIDSLWSENCEAGGLYSSIFKIVLTDSLISLAEISVSLIDTVQGICGTTAFGGSVQTQLPLRFQISAAPNPICLGDSSLIYTDFSTPGYTPLWLPDSATNDSIWVSPDSNQLYTLLIIDSLDNIIGRDSVLIGLFPSPSLHLGEDFSFCSDSVLIAPNAALWLSYRWDDGSEDSSRWIRESGIYSLEAMDSFGCMSRDTIEITQAMPVISNFSWLEDSFMVIFTDSSQHADSLYWDFGDGNMSMEENPMHRYDTAGMYTVSLISVNACSRDTFTQVITINGWPTSIPPAILQAFLSIHPQPAQDRVHLHFSHEAFFGEKLSLYNLQGNLVRDLGEIREDIRVVERGELASGIYILRIGELAANLWFE